jgi:hypothetical protein
MNTKEDRHNSLSTIHYTFSFKLIPTLTRTPTSHHPLTPPYTEPYPLTITIMIIDDRVAAANAFMVKHLAEAESAIIKSEI